MTIKLNITQAINDLYIIRRRKYLKQTKGRTYTADSDKVITTKDGRRYKEPPLNDSLINRHLLGKVSYGVFATYQTKFIIFDFDFEESFDLCKWYYYQIKDALIQMGIDEQYIYTVFSGGKGLHLTLYFDSPIPNYKAKLIYTNALQVAELSHMNKQIEFRPTSTQGVKLPLGKHYKTGKKSCYVDNLNVDEVLPDETILDIHKIPIDIIDSVLDIEPNLYERMNDEEIKQAAQSELYDNVKPLEVYQLGKNEKYTASYYNDLYSNGLKARGTRHKATLMLAIYFKNYYAMERDDVHNVMKEWLNKQDKGLYTSTYEEALADTIQIVNDVFDKDYPLNIEQPEIHISVDELRTILSARQLNNKHFTPKQKLLLFALLLHSKRFTNENNKVFYMTYAQMTQATGITNRRSLQPIINQFNDVGLIAIHRRNASQNGTYLKLPNKYEVLFADSSNNTKFETVDSNLIYDKQILQIMISKLFTKSELKSLNLPPRQFKQFNSLII